MASKVGAKKGAPAPVKATVYPEVDASSSGESSSG